jgi:hypothetical protein
LSSHSQEADENWVEPRTLQEAIQRRDQVLGEVQDIQNQLGERNRLVDGHRMPDREYWAWRGKAKVALYYRLGDYRRLKAWIQLNWNWSRTPPPSPSLEEMNPVELAKRLRNITGQLYSLFLAAGAYLDDQSEGNLRALATIYERAASAFGSTPQSPSSGSPIEPVADASSTPVTGETNPADCPEHPNG